MVATPKLSPIQIAECINPGQKWGAIYNQVVQQEKPVGHVTVSSATSPLMMALITAIHIAQTPSENDAVAFLRRQVAKMTLYVDDWNVVLSEGEYDFLAAHFKSVTRGRKASTTALAADKFVDEITTAHDVILTPRQNKTRKATKGTAETIADLSGKRIKLLWQDLALSACTRMQNIAEMGMYLHLPNGVDFNPKQPPQPVTAIEDAPKTVTLDVMTMDRHGESYNQFTARLEDAVYAPENKGKILSFGAYQIDIDATRAARKRQSTAVCIRQGNPTDTMANPPPTPDMAQKLVLAPVIDLFLPKIAVYAQTGEIGVTLVDPNRIQTHGLEERLDKSEAVTSRILAIIDALEAEVTPHLPHEIYNKTYVRALLHGPARAIACGEGDIPDHIKNAKAGQKPSAQSITRFVDNGLDQQEHHQAPVPGMHA